MRRDRFDSAPVRTRVAPAVAIVVLAASLTLAGPGPAAASEAPSYFARINALRAARGVGPLRSDATLDALAQRWADHLASIGRLQHAPDLSSGLDRNDWTRLGENVGVGSSVDSVFQAFTDSPAHYTNLVQADFVLVGIGVAHVQGRHFTVHRFMAVGAAPPPTPGPPPEPATAPAPASPPPEPQPSATSPDPILVVSSLPEPVTSAEPARIKALLAALNAAGS
jgi:hypothetical protein